MSYHKLAKISLLFLFLSSFMFLDSQNLLPLFAAAKPMEVEIKNIDGKNIAFEYGKPIPSFDTYKLNQPGREYLSLNGIWKFTLDPSNIGITQKPEWYTTSFNDASWEEQKIPGSWDIYNNKAYQYYDGYVWYRRHFTVPSSWAEKFVKINFLAVNYKCQIWVNNQYVNYHEGGYTPFSLDLSHCLRYGADNLIAIQVWRRKWGEVNNDQIFPGIADWWPFGGITREVYLEATPQVTVSKIICYGKENYLYADIIVFNHSGEQKNITISLDPDERTDGKVESKNISLQPGQTKVVSFLLPIPEARPWSTGTPYLYKATATLNNGDSLSSSYGMRTVTISDSKLLLNNKKIFLKGTAYHIEHPIEGSSMTKENIASDLEKIKDSGANFIRTHYPRPPSFYEWCDRRGILLLDEIPNYWMNPMQMENQTKNIGLSKAMEIEAVWNNINRPSVIIWSVCNESTTMFDQGRAFIKWLKEAINTIDPAKRPVTYAAMKVTDSPPYYLESAFADVDIISINEYFAVFYGSREKLQSDLAQALDSLHALYPEKPILITEYGIWSTYGKHGKPTDNDTEEWQNDLFLKNWEVFMPRLDFLCGTVWWISIDFLSRQGLAGYINTMGMMERENRQKKLIYSSFQNKINPSPGKMIERIAGENRYETAVKISQAGWDSSDYVILARGDDFPDALSGTVLATKYQAPMLITNPASLNQLTASEIKRLKPKDIIVLGTDDAISHSVVEELTSECGIPNQRIHRLGGRDRYETSLLIAEWVGSSESAIIATGEDFPDALSSSSLASSQTMPIILINGSQQNLNQQYQEKMKKLNIKNTIIAGDSLAVSSEIEEWLKNNNFNPLRLGGEDRYETSIKIVQYIIDHQYLYPESIFMTTGENFPDSLTAVPLAIQFKAPLVITKSHLLPSKILSFLETKKDKIYFIHLIGGESALSETINFELNQILKI